mmetsp:Transcript_12475/g.30254  ORF Transcript_12475/g.30254 Transcript_12475/m.30254 type:complete len:235 (-) Transcript_12475:650-1354(-)
MIPQNILSQFSSCPDFFAARFGLALFISCSKVKYTPPARNIPPAGRATRGRPHVVAAATVNARRASVRSDLAMIFNTNGGMDKAVPSGLNVVVQRMTNAPCASMVTPMPAVRGSHAGSIALGAASMASPSRSKTILRLTRLRKSAGASAGAAPSPPPVWSIACALSPPRTCLPACGPKLRLPIRGAAARTHNSPHRLNGGSSVGEPEPRPRPGLKLAGRNSVTRFATIRAETAA